ncbi:MAG: sensor histidine kinase [Bacteroidota bacterium]
MTGQTRIPKTNINSEQAKARVVESAEAVNILTAEKQKKIDRNTQEIARRAHLLKVEKNRKESLLLFNVFLILFASCLLYHYRRLRIANKKTNQQAAALHQVNQELSDSLEHQVALQREVHHRIKNNLQTLIGLVELQSEEIEDKVALESLDAMSNRIHSMAAIHEMLYQKEGVRLINLLDYTRNLCQHFSNFSAQNNQPIFQLDIGNRHFNLETLMPVGMMLNELLTNSLKYANNFGQRLKIAISLEVDTEGYRITYRDNGPGFPQGQLEERTGGLGTYLLNSMSRQLNGRLISRNDNGAVYEIFFKEKNRKGTLAF